MFYFSSAIIVPECFGAEERGALWSPLSLDSKVPPKPLSRQHAYEEVGWQTLSRRSGSEKVWPLFQTVCRQLLQSDQLNGIDHVEQQVWYPVKKTRVQSKEDVGRNIASSKLSNSNQQHLTKSSFKMYRNNLTPDPRHPGRPGGPTTAPSSPNQTIATFCAKTKPCSCWGWRWQRTWSASPMRWVGSSCGLFY